MLDFVISTSVLAIIFALYLTFRLKKEEDGSEKMAEISSLIQNGAKTFLNKEYKYLAVFVAAFALIIGYFINLGSSVSFILGSILSGLAGYIGMRTATSSNSKASYAAENDLAKGLKIAFSSGAVMGMFVVGLGLLGVSVLYFIFKSPDIIFGFGFGASSIALFGRVGGGIYTKAADVGADMVGKVEEGIPEDDPRNPASIADNVGDNVGDVAGMGADLFESYVDAIIATMAIGVALGTLGTSLSMSSELATLLPMIIAGIGIVSSIIGFFFVRGGSEEKIHGALNKGVYGAAILTAVISYFVLNYLGVGIQIFYSIITGLVAGVIIGKATEYYTASDKKPTRKVAEESQTGAATNIISGFSLGMKSTAIPVLSVAAAILLSYYFADIYGIGIAAVGMLSTLGITLATDCYGPVADNAAGIAEMAGRGEEAREKSEALDAVGNTTAAIGKGFAIGSAALTSLALFSAYASATSLDVISLLSPQVVAALFIGALLPFLFSSLTMSSVGDTASKMITEVRRQFKENEGILKGEEDPDYNRCIDISTKAALKEMITPGVLAVITPIAVGLLMGPEALGGLLAGNIATGFLLAVTMANAGGAWDNAKKYVEEGNYGGKGSEVHKATVVGDTVGDPFKDTSGPSLNILIKLVAIVSLVFVPLFL